MLIQSLTLSAVLAMMAAPALGAARAVPAPAAGPVFHQEGDQAPAVEYIGSVELDPVRGVAGTPVTITGSGFEAGRELEIIWNSVEGSWLLEGSASEEFMGREFTPTRAKVADATVADDGTFSAIFDAPLDHGFSHDVSVEDDGTLVNKAGFRLEPALTVTPSSGPVGTPISIRMEGIGWANLENSWQVTYDNKYTGVLTSVTTGGIGEALIPATGEPGLHRIRVVHGSFTVPYLNGQQSPRPDRTDYVFDFEVTPGDPVLPARAAGQSLPVETASVPEGDGLALWTDVSSGPVGTPMTISARGLEAGADVSFSWTTVVGNRVSGSGWDEAAREVLQAVVADDGSLSVPWAIPDDLGGPHRLIASIDGEPVGETFVTITPSLVSAEVASGRYGEIMEIVLKGVGWTETANIYNLVYDNGFLGYSCGFNSQGDVTIFLPLVGEEGWHFVDLYPGIYKGEDMGGVQNFRTPQLTFAGDHPGEDLPAFRLAFEITADGPATGDGAQAVLTGE